MSGCNANPQAPWYLVGEVSAVTIPFALSLSKGAVWFDKLTTNGFLIAGYNATKY